MKGEDAASMFIVGIWVIALSCVFFFKGIPFFINNDSNPQLHEYNEQLQKTEVHTDNIRVKTYEEGLEEGITRGELKGRNSAYREILGIDTLTN